MSGEEEWRERALCRQTDPEAFFPEKGQSTGPAKRICTACEVRPECLAYALDTGQRFGVWGGLSERERRRLERQAAPLPGHRRPSLTDRGRHDMPTIHAAVRAAVAGAGRVALDGLSRPERDHAVTILTEQGRTASQVAVLLGTSADAVYKRVSDHRRRTAEAVA